MEERERQNLCSCSIQTLHPCMYVPPLSAEHVYGMSKIYICYINFMSLPDLRAYSVQSKIDRFIFVIKIMVFPPLKCN